MAATLVVHTGAIGDFILACPSIACLAQEAPVEIAGLEERAELAVVSGLATRAHSLEATGFESIFATPTDRLRAFLENFDKAVVWMKDPGDVIRDALHSCGIRETHVHAGLPRQGWVDHATSYYLECLGYPPQAPLRLAFEPARKSFDVVMHPGSGSRSKNWPLENFLALRDELSAEGRSVTWCVGPAEAEAFSPDMLERFRSDGVIEEESLTSLAGILASSCAYVGNDSGITHLAAAAGCPTVAIFTESDPRVWAPLGDWVRVVRERKGPSVEQVGAALDDLAERDKG